MNDRHFKQLRYYRLIVRSNLLLSYDLLWECCTMTGEKSRQRVNVAFPRSHDDDTVSSSCDQGKAMEMSYSSSGGEKAGVCMTLGDQV